MSSKLSLTGGTLTGALNINSTVDQQLNLNSTDDNATYLAYQRSGSRIGYAGYGGSGNHLYLVNEISDGDIVIRGKDGGSNVDCVSFDVSASGNATFSGSVTATGGFSGSGASLTNVNATTIDNDAVTGAKIADDSIDSEHYVNGSIDAAHIASDAITAAKIVNTAVTAAKLDNGAVTENKIADNAVTTDKIADDAVTAAKLANSINTEIAANTAKTTNATHSGEVTGATALTIADNVVDEANLKISNSGSNGQVLTKQSGNTGGLTWATVSADGGNAATLDGLDSSQFLRSDTSDSMTSGTLKIQGGKLGVGNITPGNNLNGRAAAIAMGDTDTGLAQNGDGQLELWANNVEVMNIDNAEITCYKHTCPSSNNSIDLGSNSYRWRNIYTNDLNLSNEGSSNDVDGTWGNWTIQEGEENLFLLNRRNGKKYKFNLTEVS